MNKPDPDDALRRANHDMLERLTVLVTEQGKKTDAFIEHQTAENRELHERINQTQEQFKKGIDQIADRNRIAPAHIAVLVSMIAIAGGLVTQFVISKTDPVERRVETLVAAREKAIERELAEVKENAAHRAKMDERTGWIIRAMQ